MNLPRAIYITDTTYFIMTDETLTFHVNCKSKGKGGVVNIDRPYGTIEVNNSCIASSQKMTLIGMYEHKSNHSVESTTHYLKDLSFARIELQMDKVVDPMLIVQLRSLRP